MTGASDRASSRDAPDGDGAADDRHFEFRDRRRLDPTTGALREPAQPGSAASNPGDPANATQPMTATVHGGSEELAAARQEAAERTADLQRITAEYANYRKRTDRDKQQATAAGKAAVVADLLGVLDDVERADAHGDLTGGFKTVADKLTGILQRLGLAHYGAVGDEFDPNVHEAVQFATSPEVSHPTVTMVLRSGYLFGERVLRPAVVAVTGPEHDGPAPADGAGPAGGFADGGAAGGDEDPSDADVSGGDGAPGGDDVPRGDGGTTAGPDAGATGGIR